MPSFTLKQIVSFLSGLHIPAASHRVIVDGTEKGECTAASFRSVVTLRGLEFPVDYAYRLDGVETKLSSRLRSQGLGAGGRESIKVNGQDVTEDDVLIGFDGDGVPSVYVEFRYKADGETHSVKFIAPLPEADA
ncbi:MAG: hypothetical protein ACO1SV_18055 [Fimbriimonas sp.]